MKINGITWTVKVVDEIEDGRYLGVTKYDNYEILVKNTKCMARTLLHEITHAYIFSYGMFYLAETLTEEDVCEFVSQNLYNIMSIYEKELKKINSKKGK